MCLYCMYISKFTVSIINGPQDTIASMGDMAKHTCGVNPSKTTPRARSSDDSVVSNMTLHTIILD